MKLATHTAGPDAADAVITLRNLTVRYRQRLALQQVSGQFARGSLTAVIGPNGAGKSTLLKAIMGLLPAEKNTADSDATLSVGVARPDIAYLPQRSELDPGFPMDVRDGVLLGLWSRTGAWGKITPAMQRQVDDALRAAGVQGLERRPLGTLSSGQLQRVLFARVLVQDARLILLDEPFTAVDSTTTAALLSLVHQWHQQGRTVVAVLHDDAQVRQHFPQTLLLARTLVAWGATPKVLTGPHLQRARALADAWDASSANHLQHATP